MAEPFVEVFFCNSDKELNATIKLLEKESIEHVVNQTNEASYKYSISVPENKANQVLILLEKEIKNSPDKIIQNDKNNPKKSNKRIIANISIILLALILISVYKISSKIYSNIKDKRTYTQSIEKKVSSSKKQRICKRSNYGRNFCKHREKS